MASCREVILPDIENIENQPDEKGGKRHIYIKNFCGIEDKERRRQKWNLNKMKRKNSKKAKCPNNRSKNVEGGFPCERCSPPRNLITFWRTPKN